MIELFHLCKSYQKEIPALADVNLSISKGEFVFVTGPSGAGKTTLFSLLYCAERPTSGQILVNGRNVAHIPPRQVPYLRRRIGVVFQDGKLLRNRTVFENVALALEVCRAPRSEIARRVPAVLSRLGLAHRQNAFPLTLSGGEQQRVAIARALVNDPLILLADEPTGSLDPEAALGVMRLFTDANARGTTVVVATHNLELVRHLGRRTVHLERGRLTERRPAP
jgi:cell division transport system ATP-binding protein